LGVGGARDEDVDGCIAVLAGLPDFFTPDTHDDLRARWSTQRTWVARRQGTVVGFVVLERRYPAAAEILYAAVTPPLQGQGVGTALVRTALRAASQDGVVLVEVKTLDASAGYEPYVATRAFWEHNGFMQIDCIDPLPGWQPGNPAAIYVARLDLPTADGDVRSSSSPGAT
jgi:GNAT superfamily N-acetyltransferase